jgi:membrane-bound lytic murein transglycosylase B
MTGEPDGVIGPATLEAVKTYQRSKGLGVDGYPSLSLLKRLRTEVPPPPPVQAPAPNAGDVPQAEVGSPEQTGAAEPQSQQ